MLPFQAVYNAALQTDTVVIVAAPSCDDGYGLADDVCGEACSLLLHIYPAFLVSFRWYTFMEISNRLFTGFNLTFAIEVSAFTGKHLFAESVKLTMWCR